MLETPPTIRLPRADEMPNEPAAFERLKKRESAKIVEGYKIQHNTANDLPFKFYAEINIDNSRLWSLFKVLVNQLPDKVSCVYNVYDEDAIFSIYIDKSLMLKQLEEYKTELTQDCNLEYGLMHQTDEQLEEIFVTDSKFIKIWGKHEMAFRQGMNDFHLNEIPDLNFIDEFPKIVEPLTKFDKNAKSTETVIEALNIFFKPKQKGWKFW